LDELGISWKVVNGFSQVAVSNAAPRVEITIDEGELKRYVDALKGYPSPLDRELP
jgi:hypothetical protein